MHAAGCATVEQAVAVERKPGLVAEVFRLHGREYLKRHGVALAHTSVIRDIVRCRTAELGGNLRKCPHCGHTEIHYCSCGNRHCPTCQWTERATWILERQEQVLPVGHFFVTFTLPAELRGIALQNPVEIYNLMFRSASRTLKKLGRDHLGARLGILAVLHTWTKELTYHPHVHCMVTAGGLSDDGAPWRPTRPDFLFPFAEMKALYRKEMLQGLYRLYAQGKLEFLGEQEELGEPWAFGRLVKKLWKGTWVVDVQSPRGAPEHAIKYLAAYTHRVAISDHRMVSVGEGRVCFKTRGEQKVTLDAEEFIRRFLLHVLPSGFHKTRPYGLYSRSSRPDLERARQLITPHEDETRTKGTGGPSLSDAETWEDVVAILTGIDPRRCPCCGREGMIMTSVVQPSHGAAWENTS